MYEYYRGTQTWKEFGASRDYPACITYTQQPVPEEKSELIREESTCPLKEVETEDGWADEIMAHMIRYRHYDQIFTCVVNT